MLKVFRENIKYLSWILWVVIGLFVLFVFVDFGGGLAKNQGGAADAVAATVGSREVKIEDVRRELQQLDNLYRQLYGEQFTQEMAQQMRLPQQALERAVTQQILLAEAERLGLEVSDAEVRERVLEEAVFKTPEGKFVGQEEYVRILSQAGYTPTSFEASMRQDLLRQKLQDALRAGIWVSDAEVEKSYREQVEKAKIRYLQLSRARFPEAAEVPPADLQAYFQAHQEEFKLPEQREGAYVLVETDALRSTVQVPDADLQKEYETQQQSFTHPEQMQARHILVRIDAKTTEAAAQAKLAAARTRIEAGADFGVVAGEVSEEPGAKERGGDLGWFGRGQMVKEFEDAAFGAQPGQLVGPVKTQFGLHLIQVTGRRAEGVTPFEEVKEQLRLRLAFTRAGDLAKTKAAEIAAQLEKTPPKAAEDVVKLVTGKPGFTSSVTGRFGPQDPLSGLGPAPALTAAAFALDKAGKATQPVQVQRGWAVLWVSAIQAPRVPPLSEVEGKVRSVVASQRMQEKALERLKQARASGAGLDQIAAELRVPVVESPEFGAQGGVPGIGVNPELVAEAMKLQVGQLGGPVADAQGALLFEVKERKAWDPIQFAGVREQTRAGVQNEKLNQLLAALLAQRRRELGVKYDQQLLDSMGITAEQLGGSTSKG
ncbi:MAG TPA: hypothetical protein DD490_20615 [Acidobacteria bacterium]|nr:hypothetical protein [Acidobacteriota bacterium]